MLTRTEKYLRRQRSSTEITYTFKFPPGHRPPVSFWMFEDTDPTCKDAPQRRPTGIQDGAFSVALPLMFGC